MLGNHILTAIQSDWVQVEVILERFLFWVYLYFIFTCDFFFRRKSPVHPHMPSPDLHPQHQPSYEETWTVFVCNLLIYVSLGPSNYVWLCAGLSEAQWPLGNFYVVLQFWTCSPPAEIEAIMGALLSSIFSATVSVLPELLESLRYS